VEISIHIVVAVRSEYDIETNMTRFTALSPDRIARSAQAVGHPESRAFEGQFMLRPKCI